MEGTQRSWGVGRLSRRRYSCAGAAPWDETTSAVGGPSSESLRGEHQRMGTRNGCRSERVSLSWCAAFGAEEAGGRGVVLGEASSLREEKEEGETWLAGRESLFSLIISRE